MADVDASFIQQILHVPKRERKPDVEHHSQPNDLGAGFEVLEWRVFGHHGTLRDRPARLKSVSSDSALGLVV